MPSVPRYQGPPRAVVYCRVSTTDQEVEGSSLGTQEAACLAYCREHGYEVMGVYSETHTASELYERKELSALRERIRGRQADVLLCYALDRLSRSQPHIYLLAEECERHGARLEFVTEVFEDSAVGRFIRSAKAFAAEVEREKIIERTKRGSLARLQAGKLIPGWKPPYGYDWTADHTGLVLNPAEAPVVARIYRESLGGRTLRAIADGLTADGIPTPTGGQTWTHPTVRWFLHQPLYAGELQAYRQKVVRQNGHKTIVLRPEEERIPLPPCPAIVTPAQLAAAEAKLAQNQALAYRNNHDPEGALLRGGYVRCGYCDRALIVRSPRSGDRQPVYYCNTRPGPRTAPCTGRPQIGVPKLDRLVWERLSAFLGHPEVLPAEFAAAAQQARKAPDPAGVERQLRELERQQERLVDNLTLVEGEAAILISRRLRDLGERQQRLRAERSTLQDELARWQEVEARIVDMRAYCEVTAQELATLDFAERRAVLDWLGVRVYVWKFGDQVPELTAQLPRRPSAGPGRMRLVERKGTPPLHNDGITLRWRLE